ncbi:response regulator transcription factor [Paenibacillus paridis]|uniref:response regulator transcription factor n=1 Tax=Paenibacillus paridis TaxID=2583376 RepID=UPI00112313D0|nr:helix-turn-helix domain-containing protein [Paenibacillus paridis]
MLTAILVDDDYPVVRYLSQTVLWDDLNIKLIGCYSNGLEAWESACQSPPDIILTDIGMPKMNGLEMLEKFCEINPKGRAVVLSCHNEFKYAQQALKLNVKDYILKESLDVEQLQHILKNIVADLQLENKTATDIVLYKQKNQSAVKEKFLKDTLFQSYWTKEAWMEQARTNGIALDAKSYIPLVIMIDRMSTVASNRRLNDYTIAFSVENVLQDLLDASRWLTFRFSNKQLVILYCSNNGDKERQTIYYAMREAIAAIQKYLKISVSCIQGREASGPKEIQEILLPMLNEPEHSFYLRESTVHSFERLPFSRGDMYTDYASLFSSINQSIALNEPDVLRSTIIGWANGVRANRFHPSDVKELVLQLLMDLQMKTKVTLQYHPFLSGEKLYDAVNAIETLDHLEEWMIQHLNELSRRLSLYAISSKRTEVIKAQQFVVSHVTEKLTLEDMANHLNLNSSYFSRLFKKETNQNFIEYVNMVKLQKAKELLQQSSKSVEEISDYLGYANKSYFIKLFKREMGMRPSEYSVWSKGHLE